MQICVSGIGIVSAIGIGVDQNLHALALGHDGLSSVTLFDTIHDFPVGEVKASNEALKQMLNIPAKETYSRTALLGMVAAKQALKDSAIDTAKQRVGLISSTSVGGMDLTAKFYKEFSIDPTKGPLRDIASHDCYDSTHKIASYCGIKGFTTTISTACSSAANAIMLGARLIRQGYLDCAVVGGTDALSLFTLNGFNALMILDHNKCRPFDQSRTGLNLGEGAAYIVLQRQEGLKRAPYCNLSGFANANDAFHQTASSAHGEGPYRAMSGALKMSGLLPQQIDYINLHGTGTANNDASEGAALMRLFGVQIPSFSSTKPFTGHTLAAAGALEAIFSILAIDKGLLYPNLNFKIPIDELGIVPQTEFLSGLKINAVMSNSFGFGGNSASLVFTKHLAT